MNKQEKMFLLVNQWRESGQTRKEFAGQHGITDSCLEYWCRKHDKKVRQRTVSTPGFVEIFAEPKPKSGIPEKTNMVKVELELPGGVKIKIY